jgi:type IV pilus assembly protein PilA
MSPELPSRRWTAPRENAGQSPAMPNATFARPPPSGSRPSSRQIAGRAGFSLLELMVVVAIIAILALIALPSISEKLVRDRIVESIKLADIVKAPLAASWAASGTLPVDNAAAGLPVADEIVNDYISAVAVESGAIQITFGNQANAAVRGKMLSLRPGVVEDAKVVPISWVCGDADPPGKMTARGLNKTSVAARYLPLQCRARAAGAAP